MRIADWLTVGALMLGPLLAVQVTVFLERRRQVQERRFAIFRTLMATRATGLSLDRVQALNMIDIEFYNGAQKSKDILQAWRAYLDHLNNVQPLIPETWGEKRTELFIDLLHRMAIYFNYGFDNVHLKRTSYFPAGHGEAEKDQYEIRKALVSLLKGEATLPVNVVDSSGITRSSAKLPAPPASVQGQKTIGSHNKPAQPPGTI